jgi:hypothetical protein
MKRIILFLLFPVAIISCDVLEEKPEDRIAAETYYRNEADALSAIYAIYEPLRSFNYYGTVYLLEHEANTDYASGRGSYGSISNFAGLDPTNVGRVENVWVASYQAILRCNIALEKIPGTTMEETRKNELIAEAHFLRGLVYFDLVRNWEGVPLRLRSDAPADIARASVEEVYAQVLSDLETAEASLPDKGAQFGRPSRWAAKTLLANVYLTREQWEEAAEKAKEVIDSEKFKLVPVATVDDFENIFGPEANGSPEEIFYLKYSRSADQGFQYLTYIHAESSIYSATGFRTVFGRSTSPLIATWSDDDLRKELNLYGEYVRRGATDIVVLPANEPYQFRKFKDLSGVSPSTNGNDLPLLRYADVLLIYAEAASQQSNGPTADAYEAVNQVRRRAYGKDVDVSDPTVDLAGLDAAAFRDAVLTERAYEFMIEGKRWLDLKRLGFERLQEFILAGTGKTVVEKHLLWPIPKAEIDNNALINPEDQNKDY